MKKKYLSPKCKAIDVAAMKMFCGSGGGNAKGSLGTMTQVDMGW